MFIQFSLGSLISTATTMSLTTAHRGHHRSLHKFTPPRGDEIRHTLHCHFPRKSLQPVTATSAADVTKARVFNVSQVWFTQLIAHTSYFSVSSRSWKAETQSKSWTSVLKHLTCVVFPQQEILLSCRLKYYTDDTDAVFFGVVKPNIFLFSLKL